MWRVRSVWATCSLLDSVAVLETRTDFNTSNSLPCAHLQWNQLSARDGEATRRIGIMLRFLAPFLVSESWEPHTPLATEAATASIYASRWASPAGVAFSSNATAWTIVSTNRSANYSIGPIVLTPCNDDTQYFDIYRGITLHPMPYPSTGGCTLDVGVEAGGFGAIIGVAASDAAGNNTLASFLTGMGNLTARALASYSTAVGVLPQAMTTWSPTPPLPEAAQVGMVLIPSNLSWLFSVNGSEIEGRQYQFGDDVQYPWELLPQWVHSARLAIASFLIDVTPVTNTQYASFLASSGYVPSSTQNYLLDWAGSLVTPPRGWENKPVTWVDVSDAVAFCSFYGKRLPNDWEWQYAMQGDDGRQFPWGPERDASRFPPPVAQRVRPAPMDVGSFPNGSSPFGVMDGVGLIWQWTNPSTDEHTSSLLIRGASYYHPPACPWYLPNLAISEVNCSHWLPPSETSVAGTLWTHAKLMAMSPSYNRHGTIGFRCAADTLKV